MSFLHQAAFLLPILQQLMADGVAASRFSELQEPEAIIVAPTRELICQIYLEARKFAFGYTLHFDKESFNATIATNKYEQIKQCIIPGLLNVVGHVCVQWLFMVESVLDTK